MGPQISGSVILSRFQARPLRDARNSGRRHALCSLDLGLSEVEVALENAGVRLPDGAVLAWEAVEKVCASENSCFLVTEGALNAIQSFSELTNQLYSLMPTHGAPTMLISGKPMHRIKGTDPHRDTREKIKTVKPIFGEVLDTATGLGYTAIEAAKTANRVVTIELDPTALEIARFNPWSQGLFSNERIEQQIGDSYDVVEQLADEAFSRVLHDPPMFRLAGHLYSGGFYSELHRVLKPGGRLFHYVGDPDSRSGRSITRGVIRRLLDAGFSRVLRRASAFGVVAFK